MSKTIVVTDSTAYLPEDVVKENNIVIAPLIVLWEEEQYRDGVDITPNQFYTKLAHADQMPTTSQTTPGTFKNLYSKLLDEGYDIFSMHISSKLSGTIDSANQAKAMLKTERIAVFDTETTAMAMGFIALTVARAAKNGASLEECLAIAQKAQENQGVLFAVKTLEFLRRGGRIGGASALLGTMLNIKPILHLKDGKIEAAGKVRTMAKAVDTMADMISAKMNGTGKLRIAIQHANAKEEAERVLGKIKEKFPNGIMIESMTADVSPVIGTHLGPGAIGISFMYGID